LGQFFRIFGAQIIQQGGDALMIALDCRVRTVQLQEARQDLKRRNRHGRAPFSRRGYEIERRAGIVQPVELSRMLYLFDCLGNLRRLGSVDEQTSVGNSPQEE
jgi:hypothetical protein